MRVLHVLNGAMGGAAKSTVELAVALESMGVESFFLCDDDGESSAMTEYRQRFGYRFQTTDLFWWNQKIRAASWKRPLLDAKMLADSLCLSKGVMKSCFMAKRHGIDLIHTNTSLTPEGAVAARILGLPHVWHIRERLGAKEPFPLHFEKISKELMLMLSSAFITNSHSTDVCFRDFVEREVMHVFQIENGLDLKDFETCGEHSDSTPRARLRVGMVGHLSSPVKNHRRFIEVANAARHLPMSFHIFGRDLDTEYTRGLRERVAELDLKHLYFEGAAARPIDAYRMMDILMVPNETESFGRVAVEAMAAALPVVAAKGGGVAEIVIDEETGYLVEPEDISGYVQVLEKLTKKTARGPFGRAGRRRANELFDIRRCAERVKRVYDEVT